MKISTNSLMRSVIFKANDRGSLKNICEQVSYFERISIARKSHPIFFFISMKAIEVKSANIVILWLIKG